MAGKRKKFRSKQKPEHGKRPSRPALEVSVRQLKDKSGWRLVHPRCAQERKDDLKEVQLMIEGGASDVAKDELHWLLEGCAEFIDAHYLLGVLAVDEDQDLKLARGHFGYAYQLGITAVRRGGFPTPLPYAEPANQSFFEAGKGLAYCLRELDKPEMAIEVLDDLIRLDSQSPLGLSEMRANLLSKPSPPSAENSPASEKQD